MFWLCIETAKDIEYTLRTFHSAKVWIDVLAQYESANPEAQNYKSFEQQLGSTPTTLGEFPLNEQNMMDPYNPNREALRLLADRVLTFHSRFIRNESGFVLSRILLCHIKIIKFNPIGSAYIPLPKYLESKKAIVNDHNYDERCFGFAVILALKDPQPGRHDKSESLYYSEADFPTYGLDQIQYPVPVQTIPDLEETLNMSFSIISFFYDEGRGLYPMYHTKNERDQL